MNCDQSIHSVTNIQVKNHSVVDRRNPHVSLQSFNIYYNSWALWKGIFFIYEEKSTRALL